MNSSEIYPHGRRHDSAGGVPSITSGRLVRFFSGPRLESRNPRAVQLMLSPVAQRDTASVAHTARPVVVDRQAHQSLYSRITTFSRVVSGQYDGGFPASSDKRIAASIPIARLVVAPGAVHLLSMKSAMS